LEEIANYVHTALSSSILLEIILMYTKFFQLQKQETTASLCNAQQ